MYLMRSPTPFISSSLKKRRVIEKFFSFKKILEIRVIFLRCGKLSEWDEIINGNSFGNVIELIIFARWANVGEFDYAFRCVLDAARRWVFLYRTTMRKITRNDDGNLFENARFSLSRRWFLVRRWFLGVGHRYVDDCDLYVYLELNCFSFLVIKVEMIWSEWKYALVVSWTSSRVLNLVLNEVGK